MYSLITKRSLTELIGGLGIWNDIFETVGLLSIIGSAFITTYTTESLDHYTKSKELALLVIIAAEHLVLGLRYLISKIVDQLPEWVRDQIKHAEIIKSEETDKMQQQNFSLKNDPNSAPIDPNNLKMSVKTRPKP